MRFIINAWKGHMYQLISFRSSIYLIMCLFFSTHISSAILTLRMMSYICIIVSYLISSYQPHIFYSSVWSYMLYHRCVYTYIYIDKIIPCLDCPDDYFGVACGSPCNCEEPCDDLNGECPDELCRQGWMGSDCQIREYWLQDAITWERFPPLQWRYSERDGISTHRHLDCLLSRLLRRRSKNATKLSGACLCEWNSPVTGDFPAQRARKAENVSV